MLYRSLLPALVLCHAACGTSPAHDVENAAWGVAFNLPEGWSAQLDGKRYRITGADPNELILVFQHGLRSKEALVSDLQNWTTGNILPFSHEYNEHGGAAIGYPVHGTFEETEVTGYSVALANATGKGLTVMILVSNKQLEEHHAELAVQVAATVQFAAPAAGATVVGEDMEWVRKLEGKRLQFYLNVGSSTRQTIELYRDRRFTYSFFSPGAAPPQDACEGQWELGTMDDGSPRLILNCSDGRVKDFRVIENAAGFQLNNRDFQWEPLE